MFHFYRSLIPLVLAQLLLKFQQPINLMELNNVNNFTLMETSTNPIKRFERNALFDDQKSQTDNNNNAIEKLYQQGTINVLVDPNDKGNL